MESKYFVVLTLLYFIAIFFIGNGNGILESIELIKVTITSAVYLFVCFKARG